MGPICGEHWICDECWVRLRQELIDHGTLDIFEEELCWDDVENIVKEIGFAVCRREFV